MKPIITWIVAADGGRARIFENRGPGKGLAPVSGLNFEGPRLRAREIGTDRPGRSYSSVGHGRSAIEPRTDLVAQEEQGFVRQLADVLEERFRSGAFDRLVIAADPTSLGTIRSALCESVDRTVTGELPKDLTKVPLDDMPRHFKDVLAL